VNACNKFNNVAVRAEFLRDEIDFPRKEIKRSLVFRPLSCGQTAKEKRVGDDNDSGF